jgi:single-strand DNA-binding protein
MGISYNKAILVGRLTKDPESQYSQNGKQIAKFTMAVDRQFKKEGEAQAQTDFLRIVCFGKTAEFVGNYFQKGKLVMVEGKIQVSKYQAQDGSTRYSTDIIADNVKFMETKKSNDSESNRPFNNDEVIANDETFDAPGESGDDEVPF